MQYQGFVLINVAPAVEGIQNKKYISNLTLKRKTETP